MAHAVRAHRDQLLRPPRALNNAGAGVLLALSGSSDGTRTAQQFLETFSSAASPVPTGQS